MSQLFGADIGVLAGETSGDILGAAVLSELLKRDRSLQFSGIGGPLMADCGLESMVPMDRLSVFGLIEPLKRLPELLRIRRDVTRHMQALQPQLFLGIDSPDFNLTLEQNSRRRSVNRLESRRPSGNTGAKITAAATTSPASGPRPTSSTPAMSLSPKWLIASSRA